jgi:PAS domain S-box-containing protein
MTESAPASERVTPEVPRQSVSARLRFEGPLPRYVIAVLVTAVSLAVSLPLEDAVQKSVFIFFWPAIIAAAWLGGFGPAILAVFLSALAAGYFIIQPRGFPASANAGSELLTLATFIAIGILTGFLVSMLERARTTAAATASRNNDLVTRLDEQSVQLNQQLEESHSMQEELEESTVELAERTSEAEAASRFARGILESISEPFVVQDSEWRFQYANSAAARILEASGNPIDSVIGKVVWDIFPDSVDTIIEKKMRQAAEQRVPVSFEAFSAHEGRWSELFCYPLPDGGLGTQWKDITERKQAEEASHYLGQASEVLSSSLDYEKTLAELAHLIVPHFADWCTISMADESGRPRQLAVAHTDPEKVKWAKELNSRYPPDDNATTGVAQVIRTGKPEIYPDIPEELLEAGAVDAQHLEIIRELGLRSAMIVPLTTPEKTLGAITIVSAESGRRYTEADLAFAVELARRAALAVDNARHHNAELEARLNAEMANEAKTQFLAVMSHELRTPLNAIGGYAELLLLGIRGPLTPDQTADLERIQRSQHNLLSLINDILNYAKLEAGHVVFDMAGVDLDSLLRELEPLVTPQLRSRQLSFSYSGSGYGLTAWADPEKVRQIMLNLLSNAIKFTEPGGVVSVGCKSDGDWIDISVTDTGLGIPGDKLSAVFEPFVQLDRKLTSSHEGTGLGLAISRDLARGLGGDLSVSRSTSEGTTFALRLRKAAAERQ